MMAKYMARLSWFDNPYRLMRKPDYVDSREGLYIPTLRFADEYKDWFEYAKERIDPIGIGWQFFDYEYDYQKWIDDLMKDNEYYTENGKELLKTGYGCPGCFPMIVDFDEVCKEEPIKNNMTLLSYMVINSGSQDQSPNIMNMPAEVQEAALHNYYVWERENSGLTQKQIDQTRTAFPEFHSEPYYLKQELLSAMLKRGLSFKEIMGVIEGLNTAPEKIKYIDEYKWECWDILSLEAYEEKYKDNINIDSNYIRDRFTQAVKRSYISRDLILSQYISKDISRDEALSYLQRETETNELLILLIDLIFTLLINAEHIKDHYSFIVQDTLTDNDIFTTLSPDIRQFFVDVVKSREVHIERVLEYLDDLSIFKDGYDAGVPIQDLFA